MAIDRHYLSTVFLDADLRSLYVNGEIDFCYSFNSIVFERTTYSFYIPLQCYAIKGEQIEYYIDNPLLNIISVGDTLKEAIKDFQFQFNDMYDFYTTYIPTKSSQSFIDEFNRHKALILLLVKEVKIQE